MDIIFYTFLANLYVTHCFAILSHIFNIISLSISLYLYILIISGDGELECKLKYGIHSASNTVQQVHESVSRSSFMSSVMTTNVIQQGAQPLNEGATAVQGASSLSDSTGDAEQGDVHGEMQGNQQEQG